MRRLSDRAFVFVLLGLLIPISLHGQTERGNITGVVTDPTRAVIPGAEITVVAIATNLTQTTISGSGGEYNVPVAPGTYSVQVSLTGFKKYVADKVVVTAATTVRLDIKLELGQLSDVIEVSPDLAQLQTENAKISTAVQNRLVDELPLVVGGALR